MGAGALRESAPTMGMKVHNDNKSEGERGMVL